MSDRAAAGNPFVGTKLDNLAATSPDAACELETALDRLLKALPDNLRTFSREEFTMRDGKLNHRQNYAPLASTISSALWELGQALHRAGMADAPLLWDDESEIRRHEAKELLAEASRVAGGLVWLEKPVENGNDMARPEEELVKNGNDTATLVKAFDARGQKEEAEVAANKSSVDGLRRMLLEKGEKIRQYRVEGRLSGIDNQEGGPAMWRTAKRYIEGFAEAVRRAIRPEPVSPPPSAAAPALPDGFFGVGGFRYKGVLVKFGRATKQQDLVKALWDGVNQRPRDARPVAEVLEKVYGQDEDDRENALRMLCVEVRRRFDVACIPLNVETLQSMMLLKPR